MFIIIAVILLIGFGFFYASYSISAGIYLKNFCRNKKTKNAIAITFDDGVDNKITPKVLDVLKKHNAKATFFVIGEKAFQYKEIIQQIVNEGHCIGNHSYYHRWNFPLQTTSKTIKEIAKCNQLLTDITGKHIHLFRPPFGVTNPIIGRAVRRLKLTSIGWSIRSFDTIGQEIPKVFRRISKKIKGGEIILMHDNRPYADILLEKVLKEINKRGLKTVTIEELIKI